MKATPNRYRLDRTFEPHTYTIEIEPDLTRFSFRGTETIRLRAAKSFSKITLHALDLKVTRAELDLGSSTLAARRITYDTKIETVTLDFGKPLAAAHDLRLILDFEGSLNDKMHGFYRTSYEVDGRKRWGAATQFEATDARRAFPCWDEPDRKAVFEISLRVPKPLTALSNMPIVDEQPVSGTGLKRLTYARTPKMPTYLVAFVIADLESIEAADRNGVVIRIWTTPGRGEQGQFALEVGLHSLPYFAKWFGIPYALPKLDMVALPDFASGAMENWGLVTYRETALLVDPANSSAAAKQRVAEVIAHELAHQWFGNLVTMEWWTDLWLNEGFASYMGPKAVDDQFPEWQIWSQYVSGEYLGALRSDSLKSSHPIEIPVQNPHEIREIFDAITYSKGSSVNRMLEHYLTERVFRKGLSVYLKRYAFGNARTEDLWAVLQEISGKPVKAIMASFTKQAGYPVVSVKPKGRSAVELAQRQFFFDGSRHSANRRWCVPIVIATPKKAHAVDTVLKTAKSSVPVPSTGWIKVNPGQSGFFRTAYAPELFAPLVEAIAADGLPALDCLGVLDDTMALAVAGDVKTSAALDLAVRCGGYADYNLWATIAGALASVENILSADALRDRLAQVARGLFGPRAARTGWDAKPADTHLDALLRSLLLGRMGHYSDAATLEEARRRFSAFSTGGSLAPDLRGAVYTIVAEHGGQPEYDALLRIYGSTQLQEERVRVLRALTRFRQEPQIHQALEFALSDKVRRQDAFAVLAGFGSNRVGRSIAWAFVKANWKILTERYAAGGLNLMTRIVEGATSAFTREEELNDVRAFFRSHPVPGSERAMKQSIETIRTTVRWSRRDQADIRRWLVDGPTPALTPAGIPSTLVRNR